MSETINKSAVCEILADMYPTDGEKVVDVKQIDKAYEAIQQLPSVQAEPTRIISDTRAIPSDDDRVSLSEKVTATYYDEENEEWSRKIVTVRDVLDSVCDEYTVLPSAQLEFIRCKKCKHWTRTSGDEQWGLGDCDVFDKHLVMCNGYCAWAERREE